MTIPSLAQARIIVCNRLNRDDREAMEAFLDQAAKVALVANQLAGALERADALNSNVHYWGTIDQPAPTHRDRSRAALKAYSDL